MKKNLVKVASVVALAASLTACGKTKTVEKEVKVDWTEEEKIQWAEENGYVQVEEEINYDTTPTLEVAFGQTYSTVTAKDLMGKLKYKQNFALVIGGSECGGCAALKSQGILDAFVAQTGYKLYYWQYDTDAEYIAYAGQDATAQGKNNAANVLKAVYGSVEANVTPLLVAFTEPASDTASISDAVETWDITGNTADQIKAKLATVYTFETEEFAEFRETVELDQIKTIGNLVKEVASGDESIMFFSRYGCGSCQVLQNTSTNWNFITRLFKDVKVDDGKNFKFFALVSEDIQRSTVDAAGKTFFDGVKGVYDAAVANPALSDEAKITWFKTTNVQYVEGKWVDSKGGALAFSGDRYNELVMYAVALGQIKVTPAMVTSEGYLTADFWTAVETWVNSDSAALETALGKDVVDTTKGSRKLYQEERLIPAFIAVNYKEWSNEFCVTKPGSNDQNAPINNFYDLPRHLGVKTTGAVGYAEFVDYLYQRTKMFIETWINYGEAK